MSDHIQVKLTAVRRLQGHLLELERRDAQISERRQKTRNEYRARIEAAEKWFDKRDLERGLERALTGDVRELNTVAGEAALLRSYLTVLDLLPVSQ